MKTKRIFFFFFSLIFCAVFAQKKDSVVTAKPKYQPNFMVGFDVLGASLSFFSDRKVYQGFISTKFRGDLHLVADAGVESNVYQKNNYDATVTGPFAKLGAFYMLAKDAENQLNGFYAGGKIGGSFYKQEYIAVPIRGFEGGDFTQSFPKSSQSSYWLEASVGGRVQLFESNFYIDVNVQPKYLLFTTKQEDIEPMIVPGFGRSSTKFNVGFAWNLAYYF